MFKFNKYISLIFLSVLLASNAFAFKVPTHVAVANATIDELVKTIQSGNGNDRVIFHGVTLDVTNNQAYLAIINYQNYFRSGTTGPDAYPDMVTGQMYMHTNNGEFYAENPTRARTRLEDRDSTREYRSIDYAMKMLEFWNSYTFIDDVKRNEALAFVMGYFGHCVADSFSHTWVNNHVKGYFDYFNGQGLFGTLTEEIKHIVLEAYIDAYVPNDLRNTGTNYNRMNLHAPYDFLDAFYNQRVLDANVSEGRLLPEYMGGPIYTYFDAQNKFIDFLQQGYSNAADFELFESLHDIFAIDGSAIQTIAELGSENKGAIYGTIAYLSPFVAAYLIIEQVDLGENLLGYIDRNLADHKVKIASYRRNWMVMSQSVAQNLVKGHAASFDDSGPQLKNELIFGPVQGYPEDFKNEVKELFDTKEYDYSKTSDNVKRALKYLESSMKIDDFDEVLIPSDVRKVLKNLKDFLKQEYVIEAIDSLILGDVIADGYELMLKSWCEVNYAWCTVDSFVQYILVDELACNVCLSLNPFFPELCDFLCEYTTNPNYNPNCVKDYDECYKKAIGEWRLSYALIRGIDAINEKITAIKEDIRAWAVSKLIEIADKQGAPIDDFIRIANIWKAFGDKEYSAPHLLVNIAFLKEDLMDDSWYENIINSSLDQGTKDFLTQIRNGEPVDFLSNGANVVDGNLDDNPLFNALVSLDILNSYPGPTAQKIFGELGYDLREDFLVFFNAVQAHKLIPLNSQTDVENFFDKYEVTKSDLPWKNPPLHRNYSNICKNPNTFNIFCDAIPSLDDPSCYECSALPVFLLEEEPSSLEDLEGNLEFDNPEDITDPSESQLQNLWARRKSLVAWDTDNPYSRKYYNTPFMLNTSEEVRNKIYFKIFKDPLRRTHDIIPMLELLLLNPIFPPAIDTDGDGLYDYEEAKYGTNPNLKDTDFDKINDRDELAYWGENWNIDYDNDGLNNLQDIDSDGDELNDGDEINIYGTLPANADTDGDTINDKDDVFPLDASRWAHDITPMLELLVLSPITSRHVNVYNKFPSLDSDEVNDAYHVPTLCAPEATAGTFIIEATFKNNSQDSLSDLYFEVVTLTEGNVLCNADTDSGGKRVTVPMEGVLKPNESFDVEFKIGLKTMAKFEFEVNLFGIVQ